VSGRCAAVTGGQWTAKEKTRDGREAAVEEVRCVMCMSRRISGQGFGIRDSDTGIPISNAFYDCFRILLLRRIDCAGKTGVHSRSHCDG
jgi:hypothetical protein